MNDYTTLIKKHDYYDDISRYSESSGSELDSISDISLSDHELQLKEVLISSDFNKDFISNFDGGEDYDDDDSNYNNFNDYNSTEDYDEQNQKYNKSSFKAHSFVCTVKGCSKNYTIRDNLISHIQHHHKNSFVCFEPQCHNMNFSTGDLLERHRQKFHGSQIFYVCKEKSCDKRYDTMNLLETHQRIKGHEGVTQLKRRYAKENRIQKQHISMNRVRKQTFKCAKPGCNESFDELLGYANHLQIHPDGETQKIHRCDNPECNRFFSNLYEMWKHTRFEHSKVAMERIHSCEESGCDRSFDTLYGLLVHKRSHLRENPELQKTQKDNEIKFYERKYPCKVPGCDRVFDSKSAVASHKRIHRNEKGEKVNHVIKKSSYASYAYDKNSSNLFGLWNDDHYNKKVYHHKHKKIQTIDKLGQTEVNCDVQGCDFKTEKFEILKQHFYDDHNMKNYHVCDKEGCHFCCTNYSNFHKHQQIHISVVHTNEKPFKCDKPGCDRVFKRLCHLKHHQNKRSHQISQISTMLINNKQQNRSRVDEDYACDEPGCEKIFKRLCHLSYHQNRHHNKNKTSKMLTTIHHSGGVDDGHHVELKDYACDAPGCDKVFKRLCHFRYHQNRHHKNITSRKMLIIQQQQQQSRSEIDEEKKNHVLDEPVCDNVRNHTEKTLLLPFVYIENVNFDIKKEYTYFCDHPGCIYGTKKAGNLTRHKMIHTGKKRFSCDIEGCNYKCVKKNQLIKHQLSCLKGKKIYSCDQERCDKSFYMLVTLNKHKRDAHSDTNNKIHVSGKDTKSAYNLRSRDQIKYNEDQAFEDQIDENQNQFNYNENQAFEDRINYNEDKALDQIKYNEGQASEDRIKDRKINYNEVQVSSDDQIKYNEDQASDGQIKNNEGQASEDQIKDQTFEDKINYNEGRIQIDEGQVSDDQIKYNEDQTSEDRINYNEDKALDQIKNNEGQASKDQIKYNEDQASKDQINCNKGQASEDQIKYNEDQTSEDRINYNEDKASKDQINDQTFESKINYNEDKALDQIKYNEDQASEDRINYNEDKALDQIKYNEDQTFEDQIKYNEDQTFEGQFDEDQTSEVRVFVETEINYPLIKTNQKLNNHNNFGIHPSSQHACDHQGCNKRFITLTSLKKHNARDHPKKESTLITQTENHGLCEHDTKNVQILNTATNNLVNRKRLVPNTNSYGLRKRPRTNKINMLNDDDDCLCKFTGCRKIFDSIHSLKIHQRRFHMITKTYSCNKPGCNFRTKFFEKLEKHRIEKHGVVM